jgi:hypothetical protein
MRWRRSVRKRGVGGAEAQPARACRAGFHAGWQESWKPLGATDKLVAGLGAVETTLLRGPIGTQIPDDRGQMSSLCGPILPTKLSHMVCNSRRALPPGKDVRNASRVSYKHNRTTRSKHSSSFLPTAFRETHSRTDRCSQAASRRIPLASRYGGRRQASGAMPESQAAQCTGCACAWEVRRPCLPRPARRSTVRLGPW